jgi:hypothetical protein
VFTGQTEKDKTPLEGTVEDLLIYTKPTQKFKSLRLSLPGENIGSAEALGFEIPLAMIEEFKPPTEGGEGQSADSDDAQPGKPMPTGVPEINRGIEDEEKKGPGKTTRPGKEQDDPDGDVSKINKDIEATVPGEAPSGPSGVKPPPGDDPNAGAKKPPKGKK